ncbi:MAG TPA: DUF4337 domain-containing protein [Myxococcus sp.]|nr:DUF4337 domain-containing protein [Myxococcus sp.]
MSETIERAQESSLNSLVALAVALTATFMALCNVKAGNIVQRMQQEQTSAVDSWSYYQAKSTKQNIAEALADELAILRDTSNALTPAQRALYDTRVAEYHAKAKQYEQEKGDIKTQAEGHQTEYDRLGLHDDQLDVAEACLSIAIALFGVTALTQKRWLLGIAAAFAVLGFTMGVAGFAGLDLHPDVLAKLLS